MLSNNDVNNQLYMLMNLSFLKNNENNNLISYFILAVSLLPILTKLFYSIYDYINEYLNNDDINIVKIKFPVHEIKLSKNSTYNETRTANIYSTYYLALNHYILNNLNDINGVNSLLEIMNTDLGYYKDDTDEKNFFLIPYNLNNIIIEKKNNIMLKVIINDKISEDNDKKEKNNKKKSYDIELYIKCYKYLYSDKLKILHNFINDCKKIYLDHEKNQNNLQSIYKLSHISNEEYEGIRLRYDKFPFKSNKFFKKNIYFEEQEKFYDYICKFKKNNYEFEKEFENEGRTYKSIMLFSGHPGTGKTSVINAILNETGRNGIVIPLSQIKTCDQFEKIFLNHCINRIDFDPSELCIIIEDCDAFDNDILFKREESKTDNSIKTKIKIEDDNQNDENLKLQTEIKNLQKYILTSDKNSLNLSCVLNILDGVIELHGLMVIFTTNHPEKLDPAFTRKGRINYTLDFKRANKDILFKFLNNRFKIPKNFNINKYKLYDYVLSHAEIKEICGYHTNLHSCVKELETETEKHMYRINYDDNKKSKITINKNINNKKNTIKIQKIEE